MFEPGHGVALKNRMLHAGAKHRGKAVHRIHIYARPTGRRGNPVTSQSTIWADPGMPPAARAGRWESPACARGPLNAWRNKHQADPAAHAALR